MEFFKEIFSQNPGVLSVVFRLTLASLFGSLIGLERSVHGQTAGTRTFALVCLGSALAKITDDFLVLTYHTGDPARLSAQVISGIGFLGVGTIIVTGKNYVRGLTTAAELWTTACLGIAIGAGYLSASLAGFALIFFVMVVLTRISSRIDEMARRISLYMEVDRDSGINSVFQFADFHGFQITSIEKQKRQTLLGKDVVVIATLDLRKKQSHQELIRELNQNKAIHYVEEIR